MVHTVMVVEDDDFTRLMIVKSLTSHGTDIVWESSTPGTALKFGRENLVDAAVLDLHLGSGPTGIDLAIALRKVQPKIGITLLTSYEDPRLLRGNLPAPPPGTIYLQKKNVSRLDSLLGAISESITLGQSDASKSPQRKTVSRVSRLTDSQIEILRMMAQGLSNAEIAKRKFVTEKSVELSIARLAKSIGYERDPGSNQRVSMAKIYFQALGLPQLNE